MKQFYFKSIFLSLLMMVTGMNVASATDKWVKTAPGDLVEGDVVVIVDLTEQVALPNNGGTSSAPSGKSISLNTDKTELTETIDTDIQWTVKRSNGDYQFYASESTWLYANNTNNGVRVGDSQQYMNFTINSGYLYQIVNNRYVGYSPGTSDWRCYTSINSNIDNNVITFFKKVESTTPALIEINETNFPDDVFRAWVAENCDKADDNGEKDGCLDEAEIAAQEVISINGKDIEDLKGIEYFTAATMLTCDRNKLTSLDVSKNTKLTQLICYGNKLTSLNVSKNTALGLLHCTDNQLTSLDVSKNTELVTLLCDKNKLTSLDVSENQKLTILDCSNNLINETEMGKLVASMPTLSGDGIFYPFNLSVEDANVITNTQVDEAKSKNWNVQAWNGSTYEDYAGVEPTPETNDYYEKVTTAPSNWSGEYLIVYEEGSVAFNSSLQTLDAPHNTIDVVIEEGNKIKATNDVKASAFTIEETTGGYSIKSTSGKYIGVISNSNGLKQNTDKAYPHNLSISEGGDAVIAAVFDGSTMTLRFNSGQNDKRFRYYKSGQEAIQLYKKVTTTTNQYTLVAGDQEYPFEGLTLTKELPAQTEFYIKDGTGKEYHSTDAQSKLTIIAENHKNLPTSAGGENFYLSKANTWVFTLTEGEGGAVTLTVNPETPGATQYMLSETYLTASDAIFDSNFKLTKEMEAGKAFYLERSDDYGITNLTAAESNVSDYYIWEFSDGAETVGYIPGKIINTYRVSKAGSYTFTLDLTNETVTAEFITGKQYTLVADDGTEYPFEGLTLTQELTGRTEFYIKDNTGKEYYASENTEDAIISAENHENLLTYESGNNFLLKKANTWVFTITELETTEGITLSVNPEEAGETKYMISQSLTEETEDVFDENLQLTKEMDTTPFYIIRSDDYGIFELTATDRTNPEGFARFTFTEDHNTAEFEAGKRKNMYEMSEEGTYTFTINLTNNTVTAEKTVFDLYALVTNAENLAEGDKVIIINTDNAKAMSTTQNSNNRGAADVTFEDGKAKVPAATDIQVFTLEGDAEGWYFKTDEGYIYAASNSSNQLKTKAENDNSAKAVITITDEGTSVVFQRPSGRNTLQYNPNRGNPIFSCYEKASQEAVQIYRLVNEKDVTINISSVGYATLYYGDRALRVPAGVTAKTYKVTNGKLEESKVYETGSVIPAGQAVVLKGAKGDYPFYYTEVTGDSDSESMLKGSDDDKDTEGGTYYYALQAKKSDGTGGPGFYWMKEDGAVFKNGAHKAYLALENKFGSQEVGGAKSFYLFEEATGIRNVQTDNEAAKEQRFNLSGQRVGSGYKGIVIVNGKKIVIK